MEIEKLVPTVTSSADFDKMLKSEQTTVEEALSEPMAFRLFRQRDEQIVSFFVSHAEQLLNLAFTDNCMSHKAFAILERGDPEVTEAILKDQKFHHTAMFILGRKDADHLLLSRLASLTYAVAMVDPHFIIESCGFILQMLSFAWETSIFTLFEFLCKEDWLNRPLQEWLIQIGFIDILHREIDHVDSVIGKDRMDDNANLLCSYMSLIRLCAKNQVFDEKISSVNVVAALNGGIGEYPQFIEDARWMALSALYKQSTSESMRGLFQLAVEIVTSSKKQVTQSTVAALQVLRGMLDLDDVLRPFIVKANVGWEVTMLMLIHPNQSILHNECRDFLMSLFINRDTRTYAIKNCVEPIVQGAVVENICLAASMCELMTTIWRFAVKDHSFKSAIREYKEWDIVMNGKIAAKSAICRNSYGGSTAINNDEKQTMRIPAHI